MSNKESHESITESYHGHPLFSVLTEDELKLHSEKNKDYAQGGDPLGNFKRVSATLKTWGFDIPPELVALIYMLKQLDAAMWMLSKGYEGKIEDIDTRLRDAHIYIKLARILHKESLDNKVSAPRMQKEG